VTTGALFLATLFFAPLAAKLSTTEIWDALKNNQIKLPNTISIDSQGRVFFTPHPVSYTLSARLQRLNFEHIVSGYAGRSFLDKVQVRHDASPLTIPPRSGILTSCSMYLKEHFVLLNPGEGNFGLHTSAVLLDPIKTYGTNIMLEIYNKGDQPVMNPMVSVEVFRAPPPEDHEIKNLAKRRQRLGKRLLARGGGSDRRGDRLLGSAGLVERLAEAVAFLGQTLGLGAHGSVAGLGLRTPFRLPRRILGDGLALLVDLGP